MNRHEQYGKVYIVGAGPGDPGLMTVKGLERLKQADAVVYDRLVSDDLLSCCREGCEKIYVGKESGYHPIGQEQITEILIRKSRLGLNVVRLKGGNPFVFGRGSEEAIALKEAGIEFEIVPGVTSGLSAPVYSGIPITHRGLITQCVLITAHESPDKEGSQVEWDKLAKLKNAALIIYMGASRIESICSELMKHGMDPSTPAAVVENGTLPKQRTITARLDSIAQEFRTMDFHPPSIIVISPTVAMRNQLSWFEDRPLFGKRIVISGNREQVESLRELIYDLGGETLSIPCSESTPVTDKPYVNGHSVGQHISGRTDSEIRGSHYEVTCARDLLSMSPKAAFATLSADAMDDLSDDIRRKGADLYLFASSLAVEHFFEAVGYETAANLLEHGISFATTSAAAHTLSNMDVRNVNVVVHEPGDELRYSIVNLFSLI